MAELIQINSWLLGLRITAGMMMILIGLYIAKIWHGLRYLEVAGHSIWKKIQPLASRFQGLHHPAQALLAGSVWGWLPCGLVYSTLTWALASGDPLQGAQIMFAFGCGTLPGLLLAGSLAHQLKSWLQKREIQVLAAMAMILFGCHTIWIGWQQFLLLKSKF